MANVWLVNDGPEPTRGGNPYRTVTLADCIAQLGLQQGGYLCSLDTIPKFVDRRPTIVKGPEQVVVEVDESEARAQGWKAGFYISLVSVDEARKRLRVVE